MSTFVTPEVKGMTYVIPVFADPNNPCQYLIPGPGSVMPMGDAGPAYTTVRGVAGVPFISADQHSAPAAVTDVPVSGQKLVIWDLLISSDTALSMTFTEETSGTVIHGPIYVAANSTTQITLRSKTKLATINKRLMVQSSVAGNIMVEALYSSEA